MSIGENLFCANWVEQWRENFRERAFSDYEGMSELDIADEEGCDVFNWGSTPQGHDVWSVRQWKIMEEGDEDEDEDEDYDDDDSPLF